MITWPAVSSKTVKQQPVAFCNNFSPYKWCVTQIHVYKPWWLHGWFAPNVILTVFFGCFFLCWWSSTLPTQTCKNYHFTMVNEQSICYIFFSKITAGTLEIIKISVYRSRQGIILCRWEIDLLMSRRFKNCNSGSFSKLSEAVIAEDQKFLSIIGRLRSGSRICSAWLMHVILMETYKSTYSYKCKKL